MTGRWWRPASVAAILVPVLAAGCTRGDRGDPDQSAASGAGILSEAAVATPREAPRPGGKASFAPSLPPGGRPTARPAQAGTDLASQALPTNQWWTSALTGPDSQPLWTHPLAVRASGDGIAVSGAPPVASANAIVTPFSPVLVAGGRLAGWEVVGYGAFHVVLHAKLATGSVDVTLVQGSPLLYLRFQGVAPTVRATAPVTASTEGTTVHLGVSGQRWDLLAGNSARWRQAGDQFTAVDAPGGRIAIARVPDGADPAAWNDAIAGGATDPVVATEAHMSYDGTSGTVTQTLTAKRASGGPGVWAVLPHQRAGLVPGPTLVAGTYPDALGPLQTVRADALRVRVRLPGLLAAVPRVPLSKEEIAAVRADLDRDLADPPGAGGSYFGLKELGRLASIAEVAGALGADDRRRKALDRLRPQLIDWLTYTGPGDGRYFGYDTEWGGLIAVPAEFGSSDYNDHHFQYGYLIRAAAVLAQADSAFRRDYGGAVDLVARDYAGGLAAPGSAGLPGFRVFNPYLGHSAASGFAPFADGNNQESSSEAVAAWEAVTRWALVRSDGDLLTYGLTHYALEAATARMYWLGEGLDRPAGYAHRTAGIVWDAKVDYATFFDPKPESVQGIQLLPLTIGSLYRSDPAAASDRAARLAAATGGTPRVWGDLFAADLALTDPDAARRRLGPHLPREPSTSRALVRYWIDLLATLGPPRGDVVADGPYGLAFGKGPTLVAVNPTGARRDVTFHLPDGRVTRITVEPGATAKST